MMMTNRQKEQREEIAQSLLKECRGLSTLHTIEHLLAQELLSPTRCRAHIARQRVQSLTRDGVPKVEAIELVAQQMGASVATIRNYVYYKYK